ncbi:prepilin-type N-terminal cleavage/methylation domain-containing protein [Gemmatimonas sp.]|uniref:type IV pilus modification PilV family protein n=1 Tax=Gemmatimonas sp. TaxID=1962908 RepID=UPI00286D87EC|nr:prepilin-type N-terminal cleavage/methylation domain-containing protein [Gemmatimonas sp.]
MIRISSRRSLAQTAHIARRGFTLVSMIVAIILLAVGLSSLASANASTIKLQTLAQNRTNAIAIGRSYLEQVRTRDPWLVQTESSVRLGAEGTPDASGPYVRTMTVTETRQNLVKIEVKVDYPRAATPVLLTTLLFRGNGLSGAQ